MGGAFVILAWLLVLPLAPLLKAQEADELPYSVIFEDGLPEPLFELINQTSQLVKLTDRPPLSRAGLEQRIREDLGRFQQVLRSEGYYEGKVDWRIEGEGGRALVFIAIEPGPRTHLAAFQIDYPREAAEVPKPELSDLGLEIGMAARADPVLAAEGRVLDFLADHGHPFAGIVGRRVTVDLDKDEMTVVLRVNPGLLGRFGPLTITGQERVEEDYLRYIIEWPEGEIYNATQLEEIRRRVVATNLFNAARLETPSEPPKDDEGGDKGELPATLVLDERPPRTVGIGLSYSTDLGTAFGIGVDSFWEHRNLFGRAERLRFEAELNPVLQRAAALFRKPNFLELQQSLLASAELRRQDNDAFSEEAVQIYGGLERPLTKNLKLEAGLSLEYLITEGNDPDNESTGEQHFFITSVPVVLTYDSRDDPLNATRGVFASLTLAPALLTLSDTRPYLTAELGASTYWAPFGKDNFVLAARGKVGSIMGIDLESVPASKRFYSGGGGSVRGYELNSVGPLDSDDDPTGGRSLVEISLESRFRFYEDYGLVLFIDGGQVSESSVPSLDEEPLFAAGIGLRYYTAIGPIRLDIATPLNGRESDDAFQFYISIGQSF